MASTPNSSNEIMFDCQVDLLQGYSSRETYEKVASYILKYHDYKGDEALAQENYSSDNWETVYQWCKKFSETEHYRYLPLFGHHSRNPFDFIFFLLLKYPLIGVIFYPLIVLDIFIAAVKPYKLNQSTKTWERDTSGKKKAFFKMLSLNTTLLYKLTTFINSKSEYYKSWRNIFGIYHDETHRVYKAFLVWEQKQ